MLSRRREISKLKARVATLELENTAVKNALDLYKSLYEEKEGQHEGTYCLECIHSITTSMQNGNAIAFDHICDLRVPCIDFERRRA